MSYKLNTYRSFLQTNNNFRQEINVNVACDLLYQFPLWLCDVLIPALDATTVKNNRAVKHLFDLYSGKGVSVKGSARNS